MTAVIGREADQARIVQFLEAVPAGSSGLVVAGEAGIGKTTLWQAALEGAERRGFRVLVARSVESEARMSYLGLGDLLDLVADEVLPALPEPQHRALEIALLKAGDDDNPPDQRSVSVAVLGALRLLSATSPVLVAIDDVQWLDRPSARVLQFAVRRLGPAPVGVVVALRVAPELIEPLDLAHGIGPGRVWHIGVGPLSPPALAQVIHAHQGAGLSHPVILQVHQASGGNPFYALELAQALRGHPEVVPGQPLPVPEDLGALVAARLMGLPDGARSAVQVVAAMSQPTSELLAAVLGSGAGQGLSAALDAGVIRVDSGRLRLDHPLLGSVAYYQAAVAERRRLHQRIAVAVHDPEERARHLALAAIGPDAVVADALDAASRVATGRGAPDAAAELCELACRLTPADDQDQAQRRAIRAARHHIAAGDWTLARNQLEGIIAAAPPGLARAHALRLLGALHYQDDFGVAIRLLRQALDEAGADVRLGASIQVELGFSVLTASGDLVAADAYAHSAVETAERVGDPGLLAMALAVSGFVDFFAGRRGAEDKMARTVALEDVDRPNVLFGRPSLLAGIVFMWTERQEQGRVAFERLYNLALDRREESARR